MTNSIGLAVRTSVKLITEHSEKTRWPCHTCKCETAESMQVDLCVLEKQAQTDHLHETNRSYRVKHLNAQKHMVTYVCISEQCVKSWKQHTHTHVHLSRLYICAHVKHSKTVLNCKKLHQWCIKRRYLPHSKTHQNCCTKTAPKLCLSCTTTAPKLYQNYTKTQPTRTKSARVHVLPQNYTKPHKTLHQHCTSHLYTTYQNCT